MNGRYHDTVQLLVEIAPVVFSSSAFALKGGTAINLFVQDMPRLSVDLDLVYPDWTKPRNEAIEDIKARLNSVREALRKRGMTVPEPRSTAEECKLMVSRGRVTVKVEANTVFRGTVLPPREMDLRLSARNAFKQSLKAPTLAVEEISGSKLVAAMDRQHPRDLFDVLKMKETFGGIDDLTRQVFLAYISGHNRPINEMLTPNKLDISRAFANEFEGMTTEPVTLGALLETRDWLFDSLPASITADERRFLRSLKSGEPDWPVLPFPNLQHLPAIKWKLQNIERLRKQNPSKYKAMWETLDRKLSALPDAPSNDDDNDGGDGSGGGASGGP